MNEGINFSKVATDTARNMVKVVDYILGLNIPKADKVRRLRNVFNLVGSDFYFQMFNANSQLFDSLAIGTADYNELLARIDDLAQKLVQNYNLTRKTAPIVKEFYDSALGLAQTEAFVNAISLDKHPTLTRYIVGETCSWCVGMAGTFIEPTGDMFARHDNCDCLFVVSGYNSRNGILTNYRKARK